MPTQIKRGHVSISYRKIKNGLLAYRTHGRRVRIGRRRRLEGIAGWRRWNRIRCCNGIIGATAATNDNGKQHCTEQRQAKTSHRFDSFSKNNAYHEEKGSLSVMHIGCPFYTFYLLDIIHIDNLSISHARQKPENPFFHFGSKRVNASVGEGEQNASVMVAAEASERLP